MRWRRCACQLRWHRAWFRARPVNRIHVILALVFAVIGLVLVFDALSALVVGVVWIIGVATLTLFLKPQDPPSADRTG